MEGEKGPITYDWACQPVVESRDQLPGPDVWLLARRSISKRDELALLSVLRSPCNATTGAHLGGLKPLHGGTMYQGSQRRDRIR